jgi:hypothetical protein
MTLILQNTTIYTEQYAARVVAILLLSLPNSKIPYDLCSRKIRETTQG